MKRVNIEGLDLNGETPHTVNEIPDKFYDITGNHSEIIEDSESGADLWKTKESTDFIGLMSVDENSNQTGFMVANGQIAEVVQDDNGVLQSLKMSTDKNITVIDTNAGKQTVVDISPDGLAIVGDKLEFSVGNSLILRVNTDGLDLQGKILSNYIDGGGWTSVPATASSDGIVGMRAIDSDYLYICVATNTWKRIPLSTW